MISDILRSLFAKYLDTKIIRDNLAISLGWIPNDPMPNQLRDPFLITPIPGIKTRTNKIPDASNMRLAYL